jgi:hypothetical protein
MTASEVNIWLLAVAALDGALIVSVSQARTRVAQRTQNDCP